MIEFWKSAQEGAKSKEESGKYGMQADQLQLGLDLNVKMLEWLEVTK